MPADHPIQALAVVGTIFAALIAAAASFVNLTLTKELKTSEFRQHWIAGLREDLAKLFGATRTIVRHIEAIQKNEAAYLNHPMRMSSDQLNELRSQAAEMYSRVKLRLDTDNDDQRNLLSLLDESLKNTNQIAIGEKSVAETIVSIEAAHSAACPILKSEWSLVKSGEPSFVRAKYGALLVVIAILLTIGALLYGPIHPGIRKLP